MSRILEFTILNDSINPLKLDGGHAGEHLASQIKVNVPAEFLGSEFNFRLEFLSNLNQRTFTGDLQLENRAVSFELPQGLMVEGALECQLTIFKRFTDAATQVVKSLPFTLDILPSVMANPVVDHPFHGLLSAQIEEFLEMVRSGHSCSCSPSGSQGSGECDFKVTRVASGANVNLDEYTNEGRYIFPALSPVPQELFGARWGLALDVYEFDGPRFLQVASFPCIEPAEGVPIPRTAERVFAFGSWGAWRTRALSSNLSFPNNIIPDPAAPSFSWRNIGNAGTRYHNIFLQNAPNVSSDIRLKENVCVVCADKFGDEACEYQTERSFDHKDIADFINAIDIVTFKFKKDENGIKNIGLIANQLEEINPHLADLLVTEGDDGMLGVKSADLIYPLIAAYQISALQASNLEQRIAMLEVETQTQRSLDTGIQ